MLQDTSQYRKLNENLIVNDFDKPYIAIHVYLFFNKCTCQIKNWQILPCTRTNKNCHTKIARVNGAYSICILRFYDKHGL